MERERARHAVRSMVTYDYGLSTSALFEVDRLINESHGDGQARSWIEQELASVLDTDSTLAAKQEACRRLWRIGTDASLESLGRLLGNDDPRIVAAACFAIGRRSSARADELLAAALQNARGPARDSIQSLIEDRR